MTAFFVLLILTAVAEGIHLGLRDRFGPDIVAGYRRYKNGNEYE